MTTTRSPHLRFGLILAALAFLFDQASKWIVAVPLSLATQPGGRIELLPIFDLQWAENTGISLSMLAGGGEVMRWVLVGVTAIVALAVAFWMTRERAKGDVVALALILGGALGNILDRVRFGYVVDFADLHFGSFRPFFIFNVADACISIGVLLLVARALLLREKAPSPAERSSDEAASH